MDKKHKGGSKMYYIESFEELKEAVKIRKERKEEIQIKVDGWAQKVYGLENFSLITKEYLGQSISANGDVVAFLARQLTSIAMEDIAFYIVCSGLGLKSDTWHLLIDSFSTQNADKVARIKIPWIHYAKSGALCLSYERITAIKELNRLDGVALGGIKTNDGRLISQYHADLRKKVFPEDHFCGDVSGLHLKYLELASIKPYGKAFPINWPEVYPKQHRPAAEWYYPLYLCWFLDGAIALFETYDNPKGSVFEIKRTFEQTMDTIYRATGVYPLVVKIPPLSNDMLYHNKHILDNPNALAEIAEKSRGVIESGCSVHSMFRKVADIAIEYR